MNDRKWYIHINRGIIDSNRKQGRDDAPITIKHGRHGTSIPCRDVSLRGPVRLYYDADGILPCGAKVVIQTAFEPEILA